LPNKQVYGATKSFIYYFSRSLRKELKKDKVHVSALCPGGMHTNSAVTLTIQAGNYLSRISSMDPEDVVPAALDGLFKKKEVIIPGRLNKFFLLLDALLPGYIKTTLTNHTMNKLNSSAASSALCQAKAPGASIQVAQVL
jgi:short-subunit dehydrogenase